MLVADDFGISCEIILRWMSVDFTYDKSKLVPLVMYILLWYSNWLLYLVLFTSKAYMFAKYQNVIHLRQHG